MVLVSVTKLKRMCMAERRQDCKVAVVATVAQLVKEKAASVQPASIHHLWNTKVATAIDNALVT